MVNRDPAGPVDRLWAAEGLDRFDVRVLGTGT
jgi:hypothetical protein